MSLSDERAWVALWKDQPEAFGRAYDLYFDDIFRYVLHRLANVAAAEDVTAQTFYRALKSRRTFRWKGVPLSAWLYRIATNEVNGYLRKKGREPRMRSEAALDHQSADPGCQPDRELIAAEEEVARHEDFLALHAGIEKLPHRDQALLTLRYFEGKSFAEIAPILGQREGTLRMRNLRALKKLETLLTTRGNHHEEPGRTPGRDPGARAEGDDLPTRFAGGRFLTASP